MAKKRKAKLVKRVVKKARTVSGKLFDIERRADKDFHNFMTIWKEHVHDEITVHKRILQGKTTLKQHMKDTLGIHERFVKKIREML